MMIMYICTFKNGEVNFTRPLNPMSADIEESHGNHMVTTLESHDIHTVITCRYVHSNSTFHKGFWDIQR